MKINFHFEYHNFKINIDFHLKPLAFKAIENYYRVGGGGG